MEFVFTDPADAVLFESSLTCAENYYTLTIFATPNVFTFYGYYISNIVLAVDTVTFDYTFAPVRNDICATSPEFLVTDDNFPALDPIAANSIISTCAGLKLVYTVVVTGSPVTSVVWASNAPFVIDSTTQMHISLTRAVVDLIDINVTATVGTEICGEYELNNDIYIEPEIQYRLIVAKIAAMWDDGTRVLTCGDTTDTFGDVTIVSQLWQLINLPGGFPYSGSSPTFGSGTPFVIADVGIEDDFLIRLTVTDAHGNVSVCNLLFGQNSLVAPDEDIVASVGIMSASVVGTELFLQPNYFIPYNT